MFAHASGNFAHVHILGLSVTSFQELLGSSENSPGVPEIPLSDGWASSQEKQEDPKNNRESPVTRAVYTWISLRPKGSPHNHRRAACVVDHRMATILLRCPQRPVAAPQPYKPYTFLKALLETRSESLYTCRGDQDTSMQVRSRVQLPAALARGDACEPPLLAALPLTHRPIVFPGSARSGASSAPMRARRRYSRTRTRRHRAHRGRAPISYLEHGQSIPRVAGRLLSAARRRPPRHSRSHTRCGHTSKRTRCTQSCR